MAARTTLAAVPTTASTSVATSVSTSVVPTEANAFYGHASAAQGVQSMIDKTQRFLQS